MKQKLVKGVKKVLPAPAVRHLETVYRQGRVRLLRMRYGNPAPGTRIIVVTGATGKTTTMQLIMGLLLEAGHSVAAYNPAIHGNTVTALWRGLGDAKRQKAEFIIIELSPELLRSDTLKALAIDTVVVTNDCPEAKILLSHPIEYAVIPDEHEFGTLPIAEHQIVSFGRSDNADARIDTVKLFRKGTEIHFTLDHHTAVEVATHLLGQANVTNVAAAISAAYVLGVPLDTVEEGIARTEEMLPGNFQYLDTDEPFKTVVDYAPNETSAELVVTSAKELAKRRLIVALAIPDLHPGFAARIQHLSDRLVVVSSKGSFPASIEAVASPAEARAIAERAAKKDDLVLLVGKSFIIENS
jgi:UDP-N-acetylmuramyl tripeptide synthase